MKEGRLNKRGISPVIATVLLIAMVVVIGLIVFLWFRGMIQEEGTKFGKNVKLVCEDIDFDASYSSEKLSVVNIGNVAIYKMQMKILKEGSYETKDLSAWPETGLNQGETFSDTISSDISGASKIILIPVLMGTSQEGKKPYTCEERYGYEIEI